MRRQTLPPPRQAGPAPERPAPPRRGADPARTALGPAVPARSVPRRLFDPVAGWFRRTERATSLFLSRSVFPRVPGITAIYDRILADGLTVAEAELRLPGLGRELDGTRLLLVTDLHAGPFLSVAALQQAFARLQHLAPDVVVLGGDFVTTGLHEILPHQEALAGLRGALGTFAVLGNHDQYSLRPDALRAVLSGCGIRVLHNDAARVERGSARFALAGVDDWNAGSPDLAAALAGASRIGGPVVLASHNPDVFFEAARAGAGLVLSGHTHGGQVRIPGRGVLVRMSRYRLDEGRYEWNGAEIVVSRGIGVSGIPARIGCPPEAVLLVLRGAPAG